MTIFEKIFKKYYVSLYIYCLKFIDNKSDALDIVQNVFSAVWEKKKYQLEERHLKSYLFNSVRNSCVNYLKHKEVIHKFKDEISYALKEMEINFYKTGEQSLIEKEDIEKIYTAINSLSQKNKEVIHLSRFEGLKNHEISEKLNIPVRTVETRLFRALKQLREKLSDRNIQILFAIILKTVESD